MKWCIIMFSIVWWSGAANAQQYNVPYKLQDKFYLIDNEGKQVLDKTYDNLQWISDDYFMGTVNSNDTMPLVLDNNTYRRNASLVVMTTDLIKGNKILIADAPFQYYNIHAIGIITASCGSLFSVKDKASLDKYQLKEDKRIVLFNANGKLLYKKAVSEFDLMSELTTKGTITHYLLKVATSPNVFDICLYDLSKQEITQTVLSKIHNISIDKKDITMGTLVWSFEDASGKKVRSTFTFDGKTMVAKGNVTIQEQPRYESSNLERGDYVDIFSDDIKIGDPEGGGVKPLRTQPNTGSYYYRIIKDTVYAYRATFTYENATVIGINNSTTTYKQPLLSEGEGIIKCEKGKCEVIASAKSTGLIYKDASYLGSRYFLVKNEANQYGILDSKLETLVPIVYDSIQLNPIRMSGGAAGVRLYGMGKYDKPIVSFNGEYNLAYAYKDGKVKVYTNQWKPLLEETFDGYYKNVTHLSEHYLGEKQDYIAVIGNHYYAAGYDVVKKKFGLVGPFTGYPIYVYRDYYNIKGLNLYRIMDKEFKLVGYADKSGQIIKLK